MKDENGRLGFAGATAHAALCLLLLGSGAYAAGPLPALGIDAGEPDGILGSATRKAISRFQQKTQRIADGHLDAGILIAIREAASSELR